MSKCVMLYTHLGDFEGRPILHPSPARGDISMEEAVAHAGAYHPHLNPGAYLKIEDWSEDHQKAHDTREVKAGALNMVLGSIMADPIGAAKRMADLEARLAALEAKK